MIQPTPAAMRLAAFIFPILDEQPMPFAPGQDFRPIEVALFGPVDKPIPRHRG